MQKSLTAFMFLLLITAAFAGNCFNENTSVEDIHIGDQIVDDLACKGIDVQPEIPSIVKFLFLAVLVFLVLLALVYWKVIK